MRGAIVRHRTRRPMLLLRRISRRHFSQKSATITHCFPAIFSFKLHFNIRCSSPGLGGKGLVGSPESPYLIFSCSFLFLLQAGHTGLAHCMDGVTVSSLGEGTPV